VFSADAIHGKRLPPGVAYLSRKNILSATSTGKLDLDDIDQAWANVATSLVKKVSEDYDKEVAAGKTKEMAMEACSQGRFVAAKVHTIGYVVSHPASTQIASADCVPELQLHLPNGATPLILGFLPMLSTD
jgi:hypothetical protein